MTAATLQGVLQTAGVIPLNIRVPSTPRDLGSANVGHVNVKAVASACVAGTLFFTVGAQAEANFKPYAEAIYAHNSNVFAQRFQGSEAALLEEQGDYSLSYGAGFAWSQSIGQQLITMEAKGLRTEYQEFDQLDHSEYDGDLSWKWKLGRLFDGVLSYTAMQRMVPFSETQELSTELLLEDTNRATVGVNIAVTPKWVVETRGIRTEIDSPRAGAPSLQQNEDLLGAGIKYVGRARLSAGLQASKTDGEVLGLRDVPDRRYEQSTLELTADYAATSVSSFGATLGYTKRDDQFSGEVDAVTGTLGVRRALTRKTSVYFQAERLLSSYLRNDAVQTELSTGALAGVSWQATGKTAFNLQAGYKVSEFPNQALATVEDRKDDTRLAEFHINYQVTRWLLIHPFVRYEDRDSNDAMFSYKNTFAGLQLKATMR